MVDSSLHRRVVNARLFLGQLANHDDQQDHNHYADHRQNPHPSARPTIHHTVCRIHHKALFLVLPSGHHGAIQTVSGVSASVEGARHDAPQHTFDAGHRGSPQSFMFFLIFYVSSRLFIVHVLHAHHRTLRHGFLTHLHVLHHVLHHLLMHFSLSVHSWPSAAPPSG